MITYRFLFLRLVCASSLFAFGCSSPETTQVCPENAITTFLVVRHAEKAAESGDPALTEAGVARAQQLAFTLSGVALDSVYSTNTLRTRSTAQPVAESKFMQVGLIEKDTTVLESLMARHTGKTVLVVAHSNSVPGLVNHILGTQLPNIPDTVFNRIYVVSLTSKGTGKVDMMQYGDK